MAKRETKPSKKAAANKSDDQSPSAAAGATGRYAYEGLDRTIHEKARLGILTSLAAHPTGLLFGDLKDLCSLTDGNLEPSFANAARGGARRSLEAVSIEASADVMPAHRFGPATVAGVHRRIGTRCCRCRRVGENRASEIIAACRVGGGNAGAAPRLVARLIGFFFD